MLQVMVSNMWQVMDHPPSTYVKFPEKLIFFTPLIRTHTCVYKVSKSYLAIKKVHYQMPKISKGCYAGQSVSNFQSISRGTEWFTERVGVSGVRNIFGETFILLKIHYYR